MLAEQCRRLGISIESAPSNEGGTDGGSVARKKKDGSASDIAGIHQMVKDMMRYKGGAPGGTSEPPPYPGDASLPPGWEVLPFTLFSPL